MSSISVSDLKDEKRAFDRRLGAMIEQAVQEFYLVTGVPISSIDIHMVEHNTMEGQRWIVAGVVTDVNL